MTSNGEKNLISGPWSWTEDDIKLLKRLYPRGNTKMIAAKLCRPLTAVRQKAYDMGMKTDIYSFGPRMIWNCCQVSTRIQ